MHEIKLKRGTSLYYSLLFTDNTTKTIVTNLTEFYNTIVSIVRNCQQRNVAQHKLFWWFEEIENLYQNKPQHPLSKTLLPLIEQAQLPKAMFTAIIQEMIAIAQNMAHKTFSDLVLHCHKTASLREMLITKALGHNTKEDLTFARELGVILRLLEIIIELKWDLKNNLIYLPDDLLHEFNIHPETFIKNKTPFNLKQLLTKLSSEIIAIYEKTIIKKPNKHFIARIIYTELQLERLKQIKNAGFNILEEKTKLTALHKCWLAWRIYRREC